MATRLQIEKQEPNDDALPGGRTVAHRWSIILSKEDAAKLVAGEEVKLSVPMPDLTVKHLFFTIKPDA